MPDAKTLAAALLQTWPARLAQSAWNAVTLPGDVYNSRVPVTSEQMVPRATDLASALIGTPATPPGALGSSFKYSLYHGSPEIGLTTLNESVRGPLGPGVYTSPAKQIAGSYEHGGTIYELPTRERDIYRGAGHKTDEEWFGFKADKQRLIDAAEPDKREAITAILDRMWSNDGYPAYQRLLHLYGGDEGAQNLFKRAGFEGISGLVDGPETVLFGPQSLSK